MIFRGETGNYLESIKKSLRTEKGAYNGPAQTNIEFIGRFGYALKNLTKDI
jgi:hypothetical protein